MSRIQDSEILSLGVPGVSRSMLGQRLLKRPAALHILALVSAASIGLLVPFLPSRAIALGCLALLFAICMLWRWRASGLLIVAISAIVPRYAIESAGGTVIAERVAIPCVAGVLLLHLAIRRDSEIRLGKSHIGLLLFIGANIAGALLNAPDKAAAIRLTLLVAIASSPFWMLPLLVHDVRLLKLAFYALLILGGLEAILGVLATGLYQTTGVNIGVQLDYLTGARVPYGSLWEGNIFGSFVAAALVATIGWYLSSLRRPRYPAVVVLSVAVMALALVLSLTRGAWLGAVVGLTVVFLCIGTRRRWWILAVVVGMIATLALLQMVGLVSWLQPLTLRASSLPDLLRGQTDGNTIERLNTFDLALRGWWRKPIVGWGAGSYGFSHSYLTLDAPATIGNLQIQALYNSGVLGLLGLMVTMLGTIWALIRAIRRSCPAAPHCRGIAVGLLGACTTLLVTFQSTDGSWLAYTWYVFGLSWAASHILSEETAQRRHFDVPYPPLRKDVNTIGP